MISSTYVYYIYSTKVYTVSRFYFQRVTKSNKFLLMHKAKSSGVELYPASTCLLYHAV